MLTPKYLQIILVCEAGDSVKMQNIIKAWIKKHEPNKRETLAASFREFQSRKPTYFGITATLTSPALPVHLGDQIAKNLAYHLQAFRGGLTYPNVVHIAAGRYTYRLSNRGLQILEGDTNDET